jgi:hypothetical protein
LKLFVVLFIVLLVVLLVVLPILGIILIICSGWLESVGSRVVYKLDYTKPVLYVIPIQSILGKLAVVPVGDTVTIQYHLRNFFPGAPGDRRPGAGDGCGMWFVNSWAFGLVP